MRLFIRNEASNATGMGHFMRCFAIAEEARAHDIEVTFLMSDPSAPVMQRAAKIGAAVMAVAAPLGEDIAEVSAQISPRDWLLIDSYKATADYVCRLGPRCHVAMLDDLDALETYACDLIINPALSAPRASYARKSSARLLLGADYALIRREFTCDHPGAQTGAVAVMFGGSDPNRLTGNCARMLAASLPDVPVRVIAGPAHIHTEELRALAASNPRIELFVDPPSVAEVVAGCDLVVTAAGGSVGEMAALGVAALVLVVYDNQAAALEQCPFPVIDARKGLPEGLGETARSLVADRGRLAEIARSAHALVDGKGAQRVVKMMKYYV